MAREMFMLDRAVAGSAAEAEYIKWESFRLTDGGAFWIARAEAALDIALKAAAEIAEDHKGSAERKRTERGLKLSKLSTYEQYKILAEERGKDIASEMIASAILSLISEGADQ
jgi:23S rRNA pseudoU1915 N3-methylase RlmH